MKNLSIHIALFMIAIIFGGHFSFAADDNLADSLSASIPPQLRFLRAYGGSDETMPPIALSSKTSDKKTQVSYAFANITIELDIQCKVPPQMFVLFKHCNADWSDDNNSFLNDPALLRTSTIMWNIAPPASLWYSYRGTLQVPNEQVRFNYGGNWKAEFYLYDDPSNPFATARFFVVEPRAETKLQVYGDFYSPKNTVFSSAAYTLEAIARVPETMSDGQLSTAAFYRLNRYTQPFMVSDNSSYEQLNSRLYAYEMPTMISGFGIAGRRFRIEKIPAENEYRNLPLDDFSLYPRSNAPQRMWRPDIWRNGNFFEPSDGGSIITRFLSSGDLDYVNLEFLLNPQSRLAEHEVFVSGSFNNWNPDANWMMHWDENIGLYRLRQWVPRGRHGYLYMTGSINADTQKAEKLTSEEFEGNTARAGHRFIALIYFKEFGFGGYETIVGVAGGSTYGSW